MATIPDLWGEGINVQALTPVAILRSQAGLLARKTQGIVRGEVQVRPLEQGQVDVEFSIVSDMSGKTYTEKIAQIYYMKRLIYPCTVTSLAYDPDFQVRISKPFLFLCDEIKDLIDEDMIGRTYIAENEAQYMNGLTILLRSNFVQSTITSLIANSNELSADEDDI